MKFLGICFHDCEVVDGIEYYKLKDQVEAELEGRKPLSLSIISNRIVRYVGKRVCLKCGKVDDEIERVKNEITIDWKRKQQRKEKAKQLTVLLMGS